MTQGTKGLDRTRCDDKHANDGYIGSAASVFVKMSSGCLTCYSCIETPSYLNLQNRRKIMLYCTIRPYALKEEVFRMRGFESEILVWRFYCHYDQNACDRPSLHLHCAQDVSSQCP